MDWYMDWFAAREQLGRSFATHFGVSSRTGLAVARALVGQGEVTRITVDVLARRLAQVPDHEILAWRMVGQVALDEIRSMVVAEDVPVMPTDFNAWALNTSAPSLLGG